MRANEKTFCDTIKAIAMKFNWGTGIALFYLTFMTVLVYYVIKSTTYDNSLVSEQYYADDLAYQQHYNKLVNAQQLGEDLKIWNKVQKEEVELIFPAEVGAVKGQIHFFCPSDSGSDFKLPVQPDAERVQRIPTAGLRPGLWKVKVDWQADGKTYFKEERITLRAL
jgi:nitrogen fixation protein FixH